MQVSNLTMRESVYVNHDRVHQLHRQLGEDTTRSILSRAIEETALRLEHIGRTHASGSLEEMTRCTRSLIGISDQIGLDTLTMVAEDVLSCLTTCDPVATAATTARLLRTGEGSLREICDLQGLSR